MSRRRFADLTALAVAAVVVVMLAWALHAHSTRTAQDTALPSRPPVAAPGPAGILFIGDSYTAGHGPRELSPSCLAATRLKYLCNLSAVPGTGYVSGGPANRFVVDEYHGQSTSLSERITRLANVFDPEVVVLDGGRNDTFVPQLDVLTAMSATIADAKRVWPTARIVVERPRFLARPDDALGFDGAFFTRLTRDPATQGVVFIDPIATFAGTDTAPLISPDGIHPNPRGESALTTAITQSLVTRGLGTSA